MTCKHDLTDRPARPRFIDEANDLWVEAEPESGIGSNGECWFIIPKSCILVDPFVVVWDPILGGYISVAIEMVRAPVVGGVEIHASFTGWGSST